MRLIRSESCTFIWHPKVLMQAVLAPGSTRPAGFLESGMGAVCVVLLILFLRLVDPGPEGDLPRTALEPQLFDFHVPGPRRPTEYIRNARTFLLPKLQHRPPISPPNSPPTPDHLITLPSRNILHRPHLTSQYSLYTPHRNVKSKPECRLPQTSAVLSFRYYAVM